MRIARMHDGIAKRAILQALQRGPDFSHLASLPSTQSRPGRQLLQWLDQSGLALIFLHSVQSCASPSPKFPTPLSPEWHEALRERKHRNSARFHDMLREFQRLNDAFRARNILAITLKGFSLSPDFCEDPLFRHQTDFDFLVAPAAVAPAAEVLKSLGYSTPRLSDLQESCFTTPLTHIPSHHDDLYALQHHRQVDLHVSLVESSAWLNLDLPSDCQNHAVPMTVHNVHFVALSLPDRFLTQVLHAFRHSSRAWLRLSWLLEIARCVELHRENEPLWNRVVERAGDSLLTRRAFALILSLANRLFHSRTPCRLRSWFADAITPSLLAWLDHFSVNWALSDWPGSLSNLLLARDFISDSTLRWRYLTGRLLPTKAQLSIASLPSHQKKSSPAWHLHQWQYLLHRSSVHCKDLFRLPLHQLRWRRALALSHSGSCDLDS